MKVLHVSAGAVYGGVERVLATYALRRQLCAEMEPHFAVCFEGRLSNELRRAGSPVHLLGAVRVSNPATVLSARRALRRLLAAERFDVVVLHLPWAHAMFAPIVRSFGVPAVFSMHGFATAPRWRSLHWTEKWARLTTPALVICNSRATAATAPWLFPRTRAEIVHYPVELAPVARIPHNLPVIVQVSRMEPWKGHRLLLKALALLPADLDWRCRFIGGAQRPEEESYLADLSAELLASVFTAKIEFLGQRSDIAEQLASADVFCQPNTGPEPFGIVFIEALAARLPVVTTRLGAAPEIVDESCGLLTAPADARKLANALELLLRNRDLRERLGSAGPARASELCDPARQIRLLYRRLADLL